MTTHVTTEANHCLHEWVARAWVDAAFGEIERRFAQSGIETWLDDEQKALLFGLAAFAPSGGRIVEIGTYQGGSACFLAAGIARRGSGRLTCVDPHLGGPVWLGMGPGQRTLEKCRGGAWACGVAEWIDLRVAESTALAAVWPAEPLDAVLIDGDHSYLGALKDFEAWAPKVRPGGLVFMDDADSPTFPDLQALVEQLRSVRSIDYLGIVHGTAVFRRTDVSGWELLEELRRAGASRQFRRPWDMAFLQHVPLPPEYGSSRDWTDGALDVAYQLCFLARCGPGHYGYTPGTASPDRALLHALGLDRADGRVVEIHDATRHLRVVLCRVEELRCCARLLLPGGVLVCRRPRAGSAQEPLAVYRAMQQAGLEGCGWQDDLHWGVWQPHHLSLEAVLEHAAFRSAI